MNTEVKKRSWGGEYSMAEEMVSTSIHGIATVLSIIGLIFLLIQVLGKGDLSALVGACIYGVSTLTLYICSSLYHGIPHPRTKRIFRVFDCAAIFVKIAGTYTPFLLVTMKGTSWSYFFLASVWGVAITGVVFVVFLRRWFPNPPLLLYLALGGMIFIILRPFLEAISTASGIMIVVGGAFYLIGVYFYRADKKIPYNHAIWHVFTLGGSVAHYFAVYWSIA